MKTWVYLIVLVLAAEMTVSFLPLVEIDYYDTAYNLNTYQAWLLGLVLLKIVGLNAVGVLPMSLNRRKRAVPEMVHFIQDPDIYYRAIMQIDKFGCVLRYVCELEAMVHSSEAAPNIDQDIIRGIFGNDPAPVRMEDASSPSFAFKMASHLGRVSAGGDLCGRLYWRCPYNVTQMEDMLVQYDLQRL